MPKCCRCGGMVDTGDLKSPGSDTVPVRVRSPAPSKYRGVEQLVARRAHNPEVAGSSPASATIRKVPDFNRNRVLSFCCFAIKSSDLQKVNKTIFTSI